MTSPAVATLTYGLQRRMTCRLEPERLLGVFRAPAACEDPLAAVREALQKPVEFPRLSQAVLTDDVVVIVLDWDTPEASLLIAALWEELSRSRIAAENLLILQPATWGEHPKLDPRADLPAEVREKVRWSIHDPTDENSCAYLASTAAGERVYLAKEVVDADVVVTVGETTFDRLWGYRGTCSSLYPGLSNVETIRRCQGQGHRELSPDDERPLREMCQEAAWLLGTQFTVQVIASLTGRFSHVLAGSLEGVLREARRLLTDHWLIQIDQRPELVVVSVDLDAGGHGWRQVAAALGTARNLVARGGRILLLTELREEPGEGIRLLKEAQDPRDVARPLRELSPPDLNEATELLDALDQATVFLLSRMPAERVEELHLVAVESVEEAERLIDSAPTCVLVEAGQHAWGEVVED